MARLDLNNLHHLEGLQILCIQKIKDAYEETLRHGERQRKIAQLQAKKTEEAIYDAKKSIEAKDLWDEFLRKNKDLAETSVRTYDTFTSLMCSVGNLAVLLNLSIRAEEPLKYVIRPIMNYIRGNVTQLTQQEEDNIANKLAEYANDLRNRNIQMPELTYSITADDNGQRQAHLDIPARMNMIPEEVYAANRCFAEAFREFRGEPNNFQDFLAEESRANNLHLNFRELNPAPAPEPAIAPLMPGRNP